MAGNRNSGRRPLPTRLKLLRGNPGKRPLNAAEPTPPAADPTFDIPPAALAGDAPALEEWARVAPLLRVCGLVTQAERTALTALCREWSRYLGASAEVLRLGAVVHTTQGAPIVNPYLTVADKALSQCHRLWNELGLTPSSRARVHRLPPAAGAAPPASKWAGLL